MKLEPKQNAKYPKYAAALAAVASAAILTGCTGGVELRGGGPVPIYEDNAGTAEQAVSAGNETEVQI